MGSLLWHAGSFVAVCMLFVAVCGLLSSCGTWAPECLGSVVVVRSLSSCGVQALEHVGSVVAVHGLSCPTACGILGPQPGIEPRPLHWKVDS